MDYERTMILKRAKYEQRTLCREASHVLRENPIEVSELIV
jgi:hypothetical protein